MTRLKMLQEEVHTAFIALVRARRKALTDDPDLFTGAFWAGEKAVELGLADRVVDLPTALKEKYGDKVVMKPIAASQGFLRRRPRHGRPVGRRGRARWPGRHARRAVALGALRALESGQGMSWPVRPRSGRGQARRGPGMPPSHPPDRPEGTLSGRLYVDNHTSAMLRSARTARLEARRTAVTSW